MSHADQLARRIVVLHRDSGFLRLELPIELCSSPITEKLERGMAARTGISSAAVDRSWQRISIRFDPSLLSAGQVARLLFSLLADLPDIVGQAADPSIPNQPPAATESPRLTNPGLQPVLDKLKALVMPATSPVEGSLQARFQPIVESALTEKAIINFFNDIVAFYLIRVHWDLITKRWLQNPIAHSNAWLTVFYMVFLLVRYRKTNAAK